MMKHQFVYSMDGLLEIRWTLFGPLLILLSEEAFWSTNLSLNLKIFPFRDHCQSSHTFFPFEKKWLYMSVLI